MNFGRLRSRFDAFGFDLDTTTRDELLNEGHVELCVQSEWTRATVELGPTVANDPDYALPSTVYRVLKLRLDGRPLEPAPEEEVERLKTGTMLYRNHPGHSVYWLSHDPAGVEFINLYPTPSTAGLNLLARVVTKPAQMTDPAHEPVPPSNFHNAILDYAAAKAFAFDEDNAELRSFHEDRFDAKVAELKGLRISRAGRITRQIRVRGRTAA